MSRTEESRGSGGGEDTEEDGTKENGEYDMVNEYESERFQDR